MGTLKPLLYMLAVTDPDKFYLGAVRTLYDGEKQLPSSYSGKDYSDEGGRILPQFIHTAAFFPYFDEQGRFQVSVFESGVETPLDEFLSRYPGDYIHLVRIKSPVWFVPAL
jgi:hypothetical protein